MRRSLPLLLCALGVVLATAACSSEKQSASSSPPAVNVAAHKPGSEDPRVLESFNVAEQGATVYVRSLAVDAKRNRLWVGTSVGVHEVDLKTREPLHTFTREQGLANEYVFSMLVDKAGYAWFGTNGGGVSRYKDGEWKTYFPMHGLADYWVYSFVEQGDGTIWIGTWAGANRLERDAGRFTTYLKELVNEWVYGIAVDAKDRVWFGTEGGVSMYDGRAWRAWTHNDGLGAPNAANLPISTNTGLGTRARHDLSVLVNGEPTYNPNYVFCMLAAQDQSVWAGTWGGGVSRYDGAKWINLTTRDGLAGDIVFSMAQGPDGVYWFGTDKGLSRYDGKHWSTYGRVEGLPDNSIYAVAVAPDGDVWVGSRGAVARLGRKQ